MKKKLKYSQKVIEEAKKLYMKGQSLAKICLTLRSSHKKSCIELHRTTIDSWIKKYGWDKERSGLVKEGLLNADVGGELPDDFKQLLEQYHSESYEMDDELRKVTWFKLKEFLSKVKCDETTVKIFADVFRISTTNIVKLYEIAKGVKDNEPLLDDLLKMRGN